MARGSHVFLNLWGAGGSVLTAGHHPVLMTQPEVRRSEPGPSWLPAGTTPWPKPPISVKPHRLLHGGPASRAAVWPVRCPPNHKRKSQVAVRDGWSPGADR